MYREGEHLMVQLQDVPVERVDGDTVFVRTPAGVLLPVAEHPRVQVYRRTPADGVPLPGDVWRDRSGVLYFARQAGYDSVVLVPQNAAGHEVWLSVHTSAGPIELVWRAGTQPAPTAAAEPTPVEVDERAERIAGLRELADWLEARPSVPFGPYDADIQVHLDNVRHMKGKAEPEIFAELARIAEVMGVDADLRDEPGAMHPRAVKKFRGGAKFELLYVTKAYRRGYQPDPEDVTQAEEVAGSDEEPGPATAPVADPHTQVRGWVGEPGECGVECSCGVAFDGFDTLGEAEALRALHAEAEATAPADETHPAGPADAAHDPRAAAVLGDSRLQDRPGAPSDADHDKSEPAVWVAVVRRGIAYHDPAGQDGQTVCHRSMSDGLLVAPAAIITAGGKPCDLCYPTPAVTS